MHSMSFSLTACSLSKSWSTLHSTYVIGILLYNFFVNKLKSCSLNRTQTTNYDICKMRRYRRNILQWEENSIECIKMPTGDYFWLYQWFPTTASGTASAPEIFIKCPQVKIQCISVLRLKVGLL